MAVFGCGFGQLIRPGLDKTKVPSWWDSIPMGSELLTVSIIYAWHLAKASGSVKSTTDEVYHLATKLVWHKSTGRSRSCNKFCNST